MQNVISYIHKRGNACAVHEISLDVPRKCLFLMMMLGGYVNVLEQDFHFYQLSSNIDENRCLFDGYMERCKYM